MDSYQTIRCEAHDEFTEKRSRFIGHAFPAQTVEEAEAAVKKIRSQYWDARHNVYAFSLLAGNAVRSSDDGEPQGTAGAPVRDVLLGMGVKDCCVVVTRYFGGILLGAGGLVRAYTQAAQMALEKAGVKTMALGSSLRVVCDYSSYSGIKALICSCGGVIGEELFTDQAEIRFCLKKSEVGSFSARLTELTNGKIAAEPAGEKFFEI